MKIPIMLPNNQSNYEFYVNPNPVVKEKIERIYNIDKSKIILKKLWISAH